MTARSAHGLAVGAGVSRMVHGELRELALTSCSPPRPQPRMEARAPTRVPSLSRRHTPRPRLTRLLDASNAQAILLIAPAGFGKTSLACEWLAGRDDVAWYRATSASADLAAFSVGIAEVLAPIAPDAADRLRQRLRVAETPEKAARPLAEMLADDLADWPDGAILVIDDYHLVIDSSPVEDFVDWLLTLSSLRLLVTTRQRPNWASARRVLHEEITRIEQHHLAMTAEEVTLAFDDEVGEPIRALVAQAHGWPAVIGLASIPPLAELSPERLSDDLLRYLAEEVVRQEPESVQRFMLIASLPHSFTLQTAEQILLVDEASPLIRHLHAKGLLHETPTGAFVFHPLLREHLRQRLESESPETAASMSQSLAADARKQRRWDEAFDLMVEHGRIEEAAVVLGESSRDLLDAGRIETLEKWIATCGAQVLKDGNASLVKAELLVRNGQLNEAMGLALDVAQRTSLPSSTLSNAWFLAGRIAHLLSDDRSALDYHRRALEAAQTTQDTANALGGAFFSALDLEDEVSGYLNALIELPPESEIIRLQVAAASSMAAVRRGELRGVVRSLESLIPIAEHASDPATRSAFLVHLAHLNILCAHYSSAANLAASAERVCVAFRLGFAISLCQLAYCTAQIGLRNTREARAIASRLHKQALTEENHYLDVAASTLMVRLSLADGSINASTLPTPETLSTEAPRGVRGEMVSYLALAMASAGDVDTAKEYSALARCLTNESYTLQLAGFSEVVAGIRTNDGSSELSSRLHELVASVQQSGVFDVFVVSYRAVPEILSFIEDRDLRLFARRVLTLADDEALGTRFGLLHPSNPDPLACAPYLLTPREHRVVECMCDGLSNREIAGRLFIAESTAKRHVHNILGKLGVENRLQAVLVAQRLWQRASGL